MRSEVKSTGAVALVASGIGAAFALAACCALPMLLVGAGLSPYWLAPAAQVGERLGDCLVVVSILALAGAVFVVVRAPKTCAPGDLCARPWFRASIIALAVIGAALLVASKVYA